MQFGDDDKKDCRVELLHVDTDFNMCFQLYHSRLFEQSFTGPLFAVGARGKHSCLSGGAVLAVHQKEKRPRPARGAAWFR